MSLYQEFEGAEHSPSGTTLETDVHGKVAGFISITPPSAKVTIKPVKVGGAAYPVAWSQPDGDLPELTLVVRKSYLWVFEERLRVFAGANPGARIELLQIQMTLTLTSAPFDEEGSPLPTRVREFTAIYCGSDSGSDRKSSDPLEAQIFLQQTTPATEK